MRFGMHNGRTFEGILGALGIWGCKIGDEMEQGLGLS